MDSPQFIDLEVFPQKVFSWNCMEVSAMLIVSLEIFEAKKRQFTKIHSNSS